MAAITICSDFGAKNIKSDTVSTVSPSISHEVMGPECLHRTNALIFTICCCSLVTNSYPTFLRPPRAVAHQAPLTMGFPRQEYWSGLPFPYLLIGQPLFPAKRNCMTCYIGNMVNKEESVLSHFMRNVGLDEAQAEIKIARRNINNLRYADDTISGRKQRRTKEPLNESERGE